jgi:GDP-4-dehydro-6-deoxy-D-mannose reductase
LDRVLITGGTGFVGTHLVRFLKPSSSKIAVLSSGHIKSCREEGVAYYELDIRGADEVHSVVREFKPTRVYHLAGISAVDLSWSNPRLTFEVNVLGTYNLFDAAMSLPSPPKILNVSTAQVYAPSCRVLTEASPVGPDNPYAASKAMAELLLVQYRKSARGGVITARSFNHTGPGQPSNFVLPSISRQFAEMQAGLRPPKLTVGNVNVRRDFTDVRDVVHAYVALLDKGRTGEVYNVCSGTAVRLMDIIRKFQATCGTNVNFENDPALARSNDVPQVVGDPAKIRKETGWSPQVTLEETIRALLHYWRQKIKSDGSVEAQ